MKCFFCKYYEPYYVKFEKIKLMCHLIESKNYVQILEELKEYAMDPEVEFSREALKSMGLMALKVKESLDKVTGVLMELVLVALESHLYHLV